MLKERFSLLAGALAICLPSAAWAVPGQSTTANGNAFASVCAGNGFSGFGAPGDALNGGVSTSSGSGAFIQALNCATATSASPGAQAQAGNIVGGGSFNGNLYNNNALAIAAPGVIKLLANNAGSSATSFSGAGAQGGWNDTLTLNNAALTGQSGILIVPIHFDGTMTANGVGAMGRTELGIYVNHGVLQPYNNAVYAAAYSKFQTLNSAFNPVLHQNSVAEGSILFGWDYQMKPFGTSDYGVGDSLTVTQLNINETVRFAIPFIWGTAFQFGIYAATSAGEIASGGAVIQNVSSDQLQNTIYWDKGAYALAGDGSGSPLLNFTMTSGSGLDYSQAFVPEPASFAMFGAAAALLGWVRRRRTAGLSRP